MFTTCMDNKHECMHTHTHMHTWYPCQHNYLPSCSGGQNGRHTGDTGDSASPSLDAVSYKCGTSCTMDCACRSLHTDSKQTGY